jgi:hypothetical protein
MKKNFFKNEQDRLLWIRLNAERMQYAFKVRDNQDVELGEFDEAFSLMQTSQNQLEYDEATSDAPRYSLEELVLPHNELLRLTDNRSKKKLTEMFGLELGKIADELL